MISGSCCGTITATGGSWCCDCTLLNIELGRTPPRIVCVVDINDEGTAVGMSASGELGVTRVFDMTYEVAGGVFGIGDEVIRSAGLGKVLYVEPSEVYL